MLAKWDEVRSVKPLEGRQHGSDSYSLAANALNPIVQEMGTDASYQLSVTSYQLPVISDQLPVTS